LRCVEEEKGDDLMAGDDGVRRFLKLLYGTYGRAVVHEPSGLLIGLTCSISLPMRIPRLIAKHFRLSTFTLISGDKGKPHQIGLVLPTSHLHIGG